MNIDLRLGDAFDMIPEFAAMGIDAVIVDPPYGVDGGRGGGNLAYGKSKYKNTKWSDTEDYVRSRIIPVIEELRNLNIRMAVTPGIRCLHFYPRPDDMGCFWYPAAVTHGKWGFSTFSPILYYGKDWRAGKGPLPSGIKVTERSKIEGFPCPKPIKAWKWLVDKVAKPGDTVFDPFMGSGTTGIACIETGRNFIGVEIEPTVYFKIAKKRIEEARLQTRMEM